MPSQVERLAVLKPKPASLERVKHLFTTLAAQVLAWEDGCCGYTVWVQTEAPATPNVIVHERYVSEEAFAEHVNTEHFLEMAAALATEDLLREPLTLEESAVARLAGD
ncbi:hypothetical protein PMIN01_12247 [Paraphaeosphaeria minitans]|uniref:ABM domain-containing protein n=1 Tax=Paraphaeosphaeria minitans TaxID=565426 RepID=A0A9P6KJH4_9PLEO|nr:hypothetical protein PMIN01_12247 [Paraphaeosphaeria minitans]